MLFLTANIWPSTCCAENHPTSQKSENQSCHINEHFFSESQIIEGVVFARLLAQNASKKRAEMHFVAKKAY